MARGTTIALVFIQVYRNACCHSPERRSTLRCRPRYARSRSAARLARPGISKDGQGRMHSSLWPKSCCFTAGIGSSRLLVQLTRMLQRLFAFLREGWCRMLA